MTIVVLDTSATVRTKIESLLQDMNFDDLSVELFENGDEALEFIQSNEIDLIFSSIETEGMDGITFVDLILREDPKFVSRLFVVTSQQNTESVLEIKDVGAKRFIKKPINEEYFNHFVKAEILKSLSHHS